MRSGACCLLTKRNKRRFLSRAFRTSLSRYGLYPRAKYVNIYSHCTVTHHANGKKKRKQLSHFRSNLVCSAFDVSNRRVSYEDAARKGADRLNTERCHHHSRTPHNMGGGTREQGRQQPLRITSCLFSDTAAGRDFHTDLPYKCWHQKEHTNRPLMNVLAVVGNVTSPRSCRDTERWRPRADEMLELCFHQVVLRRTGMWRTT